MGKSLRRQRLCGKLFDPANREERKMDGKDITIPIHREVDVDAIVSRLYDEFGNGFSDETYNTIHLDIANEVTAIS